MEEELYERGQEEIQKHLALLEEQRLENHKMWDSQILALSTLALGLSLTILKDFIDFKTASCIFSLKLSWLLFLSSIIGTVISFYVAEKSQLKWKDILLKVARHNANLRIMTYKLNKLLKQIELSGSLDNFKTARTEGIENLTKEIEEHDQSLEPMNKNHAKWNKTIEWLNLLRTISFILAITLLTLFVYVNL